MKLIPRTYFLVIIIVTLFILLLSGYPLLPPRKPDDKIQNVLLLFLLPFFFCLRNSKLGKDTTQNVQCKNYNIQYKIKLEFNTSFLLLISFLLQLLFLLTPDLFIFSLLLQRRRRACIHISCCVDRRAAQRNLKVRRWRR